MPNHETNYASGSMGILDSGNSQSVRCKNLEVNNTSHIRLSGGFLENEFLSFQDGKIIYDDKQRSPLQMEFQNYRRGFLWLQNHMELSVSTNGQALGKITYASEKDAYNIEDYREPSACYTVVRTTTGSNYSIYSNATSVHTKLPQGQGQPLQVFMEAQVNEDESLDGGIELAISFQDPTESQQTLANQEKALLIGLMTFMARVASGQHERRIHNEAAYRASTILLPH